MKVVVLQTCDDTRGGYGQFLDLTESRHRAYCEQHGYDYMRVDKIVVGYEPFMATYNRIFLCLGLLKEKKYDWVFYLDADAVIDEFKPLDSLLDTNYVILGCRGSVFVEYGIGRQWNMNAGVFLLNLRHKETSWMLHEWQREFFQEFIADPTFELRRVLLDQDMLHRVLKRKAVAKVFRGAQADCINYNGPFVKQILRTHGSLEKRIQVLKKFLDSKEDTRALESLVTFRDIATADSETPESSDAPA